MPSIIELALAFKRRLLAMDAEAARDMTRRWREVERALSGAIQALALQIDEAARVGWPPSDTQIFSMERYQALLAQTLQEVRSLEREAEAVLVERSKAAARMGLQNAQMLLDVGLRGGPYNRLPVDAVQYIAGMLQDGGPLFGILQGRALAPAAVQGLTQKLTEAVALGWNPRKTARAMQDGLSEGLQKALVIARDSQMRAYRMASDEQLLNAFGGSRSAPLKKKRRLVAKDGRTCAACILADGELLELNEPMFDHTQGRCIPIPVFVGDDPQEPQSYFKTLSEERQKALLGPGRYELWQSGQVKLADMATRTQHVVWGMSPAVKTLTELQAAIASPLTQ